MTPPPDRAVLDLRKLEDYCLNPNHPRGRHKARVFRDALGLGRSDALWLRGVLLDALQSGQPVEIANDRFGSRWRLDVPVQRQDRHAVVRTVWMVSSGEDILRFITCWVL